MACACTCGSAASAKTMEAVERLQERLREIAASGGLLDIFIAAFGSRIDARTAGERIASLGVGDLSWAPVIRQMEDETLGRAVAAYAAGPNLILLARDWAENPATPVEAILRVLAEELGHALDADLNEVETPGDEGAYFAALVMGDDIDDDQIAAWTAEDDWAVVTVDGVALQVECAEIARSQLDALKAGVDGMYAQLDSALRAQVLAQSLPMVGSATGTAYDADSNALHVARQLKAAVDYMHGQLANASQTYQDTVVTNLLNQGIANAFGTQSGQTPPVVATVSPESAPGGPSVLFQINAIYAQQVFNQTLAVTPNLGLPGLSLNTQGTAQASFGAGVNLGLGVDSGGFFIGVGGGAEIAFAVNADIQGFSANAQMGILNFSAADEGSNIQGSFAVNLGEVLGTAQDGKIRLSDIPNNGFNIDATFSGSALLDIGLTSSLGNTWLPSISTDLVGQWAFNATTLNLQNPSLFGTQPTLGFAETTINFGTFIENFVKPVLNNVAPVLQPISKAIEVFTADITPLKNIPGWEVLLDLAGGVDVNGDDMGDGKISMIDFVKLDDPTKNLADAVEFINLVHNLTAWTNFLNSNTFSAGEYGLGQFSILDDMRGVGTGLGNIATSTVQDVQNLNTFLGALTAGNFSHVDPTTGMSGQTIIQNLITGVSGVGTTATPTTPFQILTNPNAAANLLLQQTSNLFYWDLPDFSLNFGNPGGQLVDLVTIPIFFPGLDLVFSGGLKATFDLAFGFDTSGLAQWAATGFNPAQQNLIADGFYLGDQIVGGVDRPEITLIAEISAAARVGATIASLSAAAVIRGTINLNLHDDTPDGKIYLPDFVSDFQNNPFSLFDASGSIGARLTAYAQVLGYEIWRVSTPSITLGEFGFDDNSAGAPNLPPALLASAQQNVVTLHMGALAGARGVANTTDGAETFEVSVTAQNLVVRAFDRSTSIAGAAVSSIVADGGLLDDQIVVRSSVTIAATLSGGAGDDGLYGGAGGDTLHGDADHDVLSGGGGADQLFGDAGDDVLDGGAGADALNGGAGANLATYESAAAAVTVSLTTGMGTRGDANGDTLINIVALRGSNVAGAGDILTGDSQANTIYGLKGDDVLNGQDGDDVLVGGVGADQMNGGLGHDRVSYVQAAAGVSVNMHTLRGFDLDPSPDITSESAGDTYVSIERVDGSAFADLMIGGSLGDTFFGSAGGDDLQGRAGDDYLEGGAGADKLDGGQGFDTASYYNSTGVTLVLTTLQRAGEAIGDTLVSIERFIGSRTGDDVISGLAADETYLGYGGDDQLSGHLGADILAGGEGNDTLDGGDGYDAADYSGDASGVTVNLSAATVGTVESNRSWDGFGGRDILVSIEKVIGSTFGDNLYASAAGTDIFGLDGGDFIQGGTAAERLSGGAGADDIRTGGGADVVTGDAGADKLFGLAGAESFDGGTEDDVIAGGGGADLMVGGAGADTLTGASDYLTTASYAADAGGIIVNISGGNVSVNGVVVQNGRVRDGFGATDQVNFIQNFRGSSFDDTFRGGAGNDIFEGGAGADALTGGAGSNTASYANDTAGIIFNLGGVAVTVGAVTVQAFRALDGSGATDTLAQLQNVIGSRFNDTIFGGGAVNLLVGGDGNDTLDGSGGADTMQGGRGDDTYVVDTLLDTVQDVVNGVGDGVDRIRAHLSYSIAAIQSIEQLELIEGSNGRNATGNLNNNLIIGNSLANVIDGGLGADEMRGGLGADTYIVDDRLDRVFEGSAQGVDEIQIKTAAFAQFGQDGAVTGTWTYNLAALGFVHVDNVTLLDDVRAVHLIGNGLNNRIVSNNRSSTLDGAAANDTLVTKTGRDTVIGGTGLDTLEMDWSSLNYEIDSTVPNGSYAAGYSGVFFHRFDGNNPDLSRVDYSTVERFNLKGGQTHDTLRTGDGNDIVSGNAGNDHIVTGKGVDIIDGGAGTADRWEADKSFALANQRIAINLTSTTVQGAYLSIGKVSGIEALTLKTGAGADSITTLSTFLHDVIDTGDNGDVVAIAGGRDIVAMGAGDDRLIVDWSYVNYEIDTSGLGQAPLTPSVGSGWSGVFFHRFDGNNPELNRVDFSGVERFDIKGGSARDTLRTGDLNDLVAGNGGDDHMLTGRGVDQVDGGAGTADRWEADKSFASATESVSVDLTSAGLQSRYMTIGTVRGVEALTLKTGAAADRITTLGSFLHDVIDTGAGADEVKVAGGRDAVALGAGDDKLVVDWSNVTYALDTRGVGEIPLTASPGSGWSGVYFHTFDGNNPELNRVDFTGVERFDIKGGSNHDTLKTGDSADVVAGNGGNDHLITGRGADTVDGGVTMANGVATTGADRWSADKSALTVGFALDLTSAGLQASYAIDAVAASVRGIETLGRSADERFLTGSGHDLITTRADFLSDFIDTGAGADEVKVTGGRDAVALGTGDDKLVVDWSNLTYSIDTRGVGELPLTASPGSGWSGVYFHTADGNNPELNRVDFTGVERFDVKSGSHHDTIKTGDGADVVAGNAGNDHLMTGRGADTVDGGLTLVDGVATTGADRWGADKSDLTVGLALDLTSAGVQASYAIGGVAATVRGIEALGTSGGDVFLTGSGADVVTTRRDFLTDWIDTGAGADEVKVAGGRDAVALGSGDDKLVIDWSNVTYAIDTTGVGEVPLTASPGSGWSGVYFHTADGNNPQLNRVEFTGVERFDVKSGSDHDRLRTGDGADVVAGNGGNDHLITGRGADTVDGGVTMVDGAAAAGADRWEADKSAATAAIVLDLTAADVQSTYVIGGATATVRGVEVLGTSDAARFQTGSGADVITTRGDFLHDAISTNQGADIVKVSGGRDLVAMGAGADLLVVDWSNIDYVIATSALSGTLAAGYGGVYFHGPDGNNGGLNRVDFTGVERFDLKSGSANDTLRTGDGNDVVFSNGGDDHLITGKGVDIVDAGAGAADRWEADKSFAAANQAITVNLTLGGIQSSYMATGRVSGVEVLTLKTGAGADRITTRGDFLHDVIDAGAGADIVKVAGGRDNVAMGAGDDLLIVDLSAVTYEMTTTALTGSLASGYDGIYFHRFDGNNGALNRVDFTGVERFDVKGGSSHDTLRTGDGADIVAGNAGNDHLITGRGIDVIDGGAGDDRWEADKSFATAAQGVTIDLTLAGVQSTYLGTGTVRGIETLTLKTGAGADVVTTRGAFFNDVIDNGAGADVVKVAGGRDIVDMGDGADRLIVDWSTIDYAIDTTALSASLNSGYSGAYFHTFDGNNGALNRVDFTGVERFDLRGGTSNDRLRTGDGADVLNGKAGADTLTGGLAADVFVFDSTVGFDTVTDFVAGTDKIHLASSTFRGLTVGTLASDRFVTGAMATDALDRIIYDASSGDLLFDADGSGAGAAIRFAALTAGLQIANTDFVVV